VKPSRLLPAVLAALVVLSAVLLVRDFIRGTGYETDLLALLPTDRRRPLVSQAIARMGEAGARKVVLLLKHKDLESAGRAADAAAAALKGREGVTHVLSRVDGDVFGIGRDFYLPFRYRLLSPAQRERLLKESDAGLLSRATESLYALLGPPRLAPLESDPFGLFSERLLEAASLSPLRVDGSRLTVRDGGDVWVVVFVDLSGQASSISQQQALAAVIDGAVLAAKTAGAAEVLRSGFILHSDRASRQAQREMWLIGTGSALGIMLLMLAVFRSLKPMALTMLSIGVGCLIAAGLSRLFFPHMHMLTFVFGSSIIGVAEDYSVHYVSGCADPNRPWDAEGRMREILPSLWLALVTTVAGYAALALLPFPILREMAVFSLLGLLGAWLATVAWLPLLSRRMPAIQLGPLPGLLERVWARWPRFDRGWGLKATLAVLLVLSVWGMTRLRPDDDVRRLFQSAPDLVREQGRVETLLRLPGAGTFFLLSAPDEQALLEREETLSEGLEEARRQGHIRDFQGVSQFVPSLRRQEADAALQWRRLYREGGLASRLFADLGSPEVAALARGQAQAATRSLTPQTWLDAPLSMPFRSLWMGKTASGWASVVALGGVEGAPAARALRGLAARVPGTVFVDELSDISSLMGSFRAGIARLLIPGYLLVALVLYFACGARTWRVLLPAALASVFTLGFFGLTGRNPDLFCILGLVLTLGMGIDYGIFFQHGETDDPRVALLSSSVAAITTWASFGLLALSQTAALQSFGLSTFLGILLSWLLAPCFHSAEAV